MESRSYTKATTTSGDVRVKFTLISSNGNALSESKHAEKYREIKDRIASDTSGKAPDLGYIIRHIENQEQSISFAFDNIELIKDDVRDIVRANREMEISLQGTDNTVKGMKKTMNVLSVLYLVLLCCTAVFAIIVLHLLEVI